MAVIEEEPSETSNPKPQFDSKTAAATPCYDSDGYDTASETELNDAAYESDNNSDDKRNMGDEIGLKNDAVALNQEKEEQPQDMSVFVENEVNELKQKALERSNYVKLEGNSLFKDGLYEEALLKYDTAIQIAQEVPSSTETVSMCYANRAACFAKLGKYEETVKECTKALELNPAYIKVLLRRGEAHEKLGKYEESITDMNKILELDQSNDQARRSIVRLTPLAEEKREKMKEEMIGKLKEMGNSILGRFGMSTDNFKAVKDPNTGSYSISFQK